MKHSSHTIALLPAVLLAVATLIISCSTDDDYRHIIPKDAVAVGRVNLSALPQLAAVSQLGSLCSDTDKPYYLFATRSGYYGLIATSADAQQASGYQWSAIGKDWLMASNGTNTLVMGPARGREQDNLRREMQRYLRQESKSSAIGTPLLETVETQSTPAALAIAPEALPMELRQLLASELGIRSAADALLLATIAADADTIAAHLTIVNATQTVEARMQVLDETFFHKISGQMVRITPPATSLFVIANLDGSHILKALRSTEMVRTALVAMNTVADVDAILAAIRGDISLAVTRWNEGTDAEAVLTATVASKQFMKQSDYWVESAARQNSYTFTPLSRRRFAFSMNDISLWFGQRDDQVYVASTDSLSQVGTHTGDRYLRTRQHDIAGLRLYATLDLTGQPLFNDLAQLGLKRISIAMPRTGELDIKAVIDSEK